MGVDTLAYKRVYLKEGELYFDECYDDLNSRNKNWFKYPNSELIDIARKFFQISKGDIDFRYYVMYDATMDYYETPIYKEKCLSFYNEIKELDFDKVTKDLTAALDYYGQYELDFLPSMYRDCTDKEIVDYLLMLAKEKYYIFYDV